MNKKILPQFCTLNLRQFTPSSPPRDPPKRGRICLWFIELKILYRRQSKFSAKLDKVGLVLLFCWLLYLFIVF